MPDTPPTRSEVECAWHSFADGSTSREDTSTWAERFMLGEYEDQPDIMVMQAVQYLHGFDMTYRSPDHRLIGHGPPGTYVHTLDDVATELHGWLGRCEDYDSDPATWLAKRRERRAAGQPESDG